MNGETILVVDDYAPVRDALQLLLEDHDYHVLTACDGTDALATLQSAPPDLVVADVSMPTMDGYDLYHAVRANPEWHHIPIVFLTGKTTREERLRGKALGIEDYLVKPFDPDELLIVIRAKLDRTRDLQASAESELQQLKSEIARALSHELRTPLTWIVAYTELAMSYLDAVPPEELAEFLKHVLAGGSRITRLADDLLVLIRLDTGELSEQIQQALKPRNDLADIVQRTVGDFTARATAKGLKLHVQADDVVPTVVLSEDLFCDALSRLVDNGIKFAGDTGTQVTVTVRAVDHRVEIAVSDDGIGIAPRHLHHIFDRFRQINRDRLEQQGVGLGLALAQELIKLQHGEITVASTLGEGSTFTISLPIAGSAAALTQPAAG